MATRITFLLAPDQIGPAPSTNIYVSISDTDELAAHAVSHFEAVPNPTVPGKLIFQYKYMLPLIVASATPDINDSVLLAQALFRGTFTEKFMETVIVHLAALGVFGVSYDCRDLLYSAAHKKTQDSATRLPITSNDFVALLQWVPGQFGPAASHPWAAYLCFRHLVQAGLVDLFPLAPILFEAAPYFNTAQVINAARPFLFVINAQQTELIKYSPIPAAASYPPDLLCSIFANFLVDSQMPDILFVLGY